MNLNKPGFKNLALGTEATDWDASGVDFLIGRLYEAFALGGQAFQNVKPFAVACRIFDVGQDKQEVDLSEAIARCIQVEQTNSEPPSDVCCLSVIPDAYKNAGGIGKIDYQRPIQKHFADRIYSLEDN
ncbi:hypothetical protein ACHAXA_008709 [Cyclostephanos tholiformis]|uniref:Uncharacterized protein n=1 Tax=Cyclostephanos tholiformis TaxID=382380 RepID=A0ABD3R3Q7_9STRA